MRIIPVDDIPAAWDVARPNILKALDRSMGRWGERDILAALVSSPEFWTLWLHENAALVTRLVGYPRMAVCEIVLAGGENLKSWAQYETLICDYARSKGCQQIEMYGREGWDRIKTEGWEKTGVRLTKEL